MGDLTKNFSRSEFVCKCGCGRADMDPVFVDLLQEIRDAFGKPLTVSSGYRCPDHNQRVSSTGRTGPHTTGRAVDIAISGGDAHRLLTVAVSKGIRGVGVAQKGAHGGRFLHLDTIQGGSRPWVWSY